MTLVETLALTVGPGIAKVILKTWLKDSNIAVDTASSLVDLLALKTKDKVARQRGRRQFEEIGERVAESLMPMFEEFRLDESSRVAVALSLVKTLESAKIDPQLLAQKDLDPSEVERFLLDSRSDATRDFSEAETALYKRLISESASYIVDISSQLPTFSERTFGEVLKRERLLLKKTDQILKEIRGIRKKSQMTNPEAEAARFESEYRRSVIRKLDELELFGADVSTASRRHRLSVAYVSLFVEQTVSDVDAEFSVKRTTVRSKRREEDDEEGKIMLSVDEALARSSRLIIRGLAGSGKTTLLKWVAVRSALRSFEDQLSDWNNTIPFFIRLRQCVETGLPAPEGFPSLIASAVSGTMPHGWVHEELRSGRAIVLVDGVDEVPQLQRSDLHGWLKDLSETYERARFIVSSRPHAVDEGWLEREGFDEAELQPMELPDIFAFIDHWHVAVRQELHSDEEKRELSDLASDLKKVVQGSSPIRILGTNPMLCSMLCALHRDRNRQIPSDRIELYEACCQMLLERRDIERRIELRDYPRLTYRQKRTLLEDLAYWMMTNNWPMVPIDRADSRLDRKMKNMAIDGKGITASEVRRLFIDRSGMIREPILDHLDFTHRTFQEFLAARAALDAGDIGLLLNNAHNDQWQEVIVLASGLASTRIREELIRGLIEAGDRKRRLRHQLHLLAVACLETSLELGSKVREEIQKRLTKLVPPRNLTEAKALSSAGDLAVPHLRYKKKGYAATVAAACVRALSLIGGEAALMALEDYRVDSRKAVWKELFRALDSFDREAYFIRVLSHYPARDLDLDRVSSLAGFENLQQLTSLSLRNCEKVVDLTPLVTLANLRILRLVRFGQVTDLGPLRKLTNLTHLRLLFFPRVSDVTALGALTKLKNLELLGLMRVKDLCPLGSLTKLSSLSLCRLRQVASLQPLEKLNKLSSLILWDLKQVTSLKPLEKLKDLSVFSLSDLGKVDDLKPLKKLNKLSSLTLSNLKHMKNLKLLERLTGLSSLRLRNMEQVTSLKPLEELTNLSSLELADLEHVTNLKPLEKLKNLSSLKLANLKQVTSLKPLEKLNKLHYLLLLGLDRVSDLKPLAGLESLRELHLGGLMGTIELPRRIQETRLVFRDWWL